MNKNGFMLIEVMIVAIIIGLLVAIAVPSFIKAKKQAEAKRHKKAMGQLLVPNQENILVPSIPIKTPLQIVAMGSCLAFEVYKVADTSYTPEKTFYVVVSSNSVFQKISLEKTE